MRQRFGVEIRVMRTNRDPKGYYVDSAYPINED